MQMFAEWFVGIADRRDHQPRLLAYVLNFRIDQDADCRDCAAEALRAAGREMMGERQEDKLLEKIQYGVDGDPRCNHSAEGLPWPHTERPPLEARVIVRAFAQRCIQPVMDELSSWTEYARVSSATLLQTLFVYHEDHVTEKLSKIVIALCKALKRGRNEKYGSEHRQSVLECARVLGRYVVPDSFVPFLAPRVSGDLEVLPGGIDADQRADVTDLLGAMIRAPRVLPYYLASRRSRKCSRIRTWWGRRRRTCATLLRLLVRPWLMLLLLPRMRWLPRSSLRADVESLEAALLSCYGPSPRVARRRRFHDTGR